MKSLKVRFNSAIASPTNHQIIVAFYAQDTYFFVVNVDAYLRSQGRERGWLPSVCPTKVFTT